MWNRAVSASFTEPKSTVAVAVLPLTSYTSQITAWLPRGAARIEVGTGRLELMGR
jgi:hypothetical protein